MAFIYFDSLLMVQDQLYDSPWNYYTSRTHKNMGLLYWDIDSLKKARFHFDKAMQIRQRIFGTQHPKVANMYSLDGDWYYDQGHFKKALLSFKKQYNIIDRLYDRGDPDLIYNIADIAKSLVALNKYNEANAWFKRGFENLKIADTYLQTSDKNQVSIPLHEGTAYFLAQHAQALYQQYVYTQDSEYLLQAFAYYNDLIVRLEAVRVHSSYSEDKRALIQEHLALYEQALHVALLCYDIHQEVAMLEQALQIAEKSKAALLNEHINVAVINAESSIPKIMLHKEKALQQLLENTTNDAERIAYAASIDSLKNIIQKKYPQYYNLRYSYEPVGLYKIQSTLAPDEMILNYVFGDTILFTFFMNQDTIGCHRQKISADLYKDVLALNKSVETYFVNPNALQKGLSHYDSSFAVLSSNLYQQLITPIHAQLKKKLIIIPHRELAYVPFELLLSGKPAHLGAYHAYNDLLDEHVVSYSFSTSHFMAQKNKATRQHTTSYAFVPDFTSSVRFDLKGTHYAFSALKNSFSEGKKVVRHLSKAKYYAAEKATKEAFLEKSKSASTIHIATHAQVNDDYPRQSFVAFQMDPQKDIEENVLFLSDVYHLQMPTQLLVLSACETANGRLHPGTGVSSLGMGFAHAGAQSIVTSLWPVNDQYATTFMDQFYAALSEGMPKDESLRKAKLHFKNQNIHPFYWAGYILMGSNSPLPKTPFIYTFFWLFIFAIAGVLLVSVLWKRKVNI